jgi:predicted outer membrane repeat protein
MKLQRHFFKVKGNRKLKLAGLLLLLSISMFAGLLLTGLPVAQAANTLTVTNLKDSGTGSLREAINTAASGDTINFNLSGCPCTITLTSGELTVSKTLSITGPSSGLTISGNNASRVIRIYPGGDLTLQNLTIANGKATSFEDEQDGGGVLVVGGALRAFNSTFRNNTAGSHGGAISVSLAYSNDGGTLELTNSTIVNNSAYSTGAIFARFGKVSITNSTITANSASREIGGIWNYLNSGTFSLKNTIVAGNTAPSTSDIANGFTSQGYNLLGISNGSNGLTNGVNNDLVGSVDSPLDPGFDPAGLKANGGPTQTIGLVSSSPAINKIPRIYCSLTDQRGYYRPGMCDIGAFEFNGQTEPIPDITAPVTNATTDPTSPNTNDWFNSDVTVSFSASDTQDGVKSITYSLNGGTPTTVNDVSTSLSITTEGTTNLSYYATDYASNKEVTKTLTIKLDKTAPTITVTRTKADGSTYTPGTWTNQSVTVTFTCSDAVSGFLAGNSYQCGSDTSGSSGGSSFSIGVSDLAGNSASAQSGSIMIDKEPPTVTASAKNADGTTYTAGTWTSQTVTVSFSCSDDLSGLSGSCPASVTISTPGITDTVSSGAVKDNVGNSASASFGPIKIGSPLSVVANLERSPVDNNGWYNAPLKVTFSATGGAGSVSCDTPKTYSGPDSATASVTGSCSDQAGQTVSASTTFKYDATKPTISASAKKADGSAYIAGSWTNQNVTVHFNCTDNLSGVVACPADQTVSTEGITNVASGNVSDLALNIASTSLQVKLDKTAPSVTATPDRAPDSNGWYNHALSFSFSGNDGSGSGVASCDLPKTYNGSDSATASVTGKCTDVAGNMGSITSTFQYDATKPSVTYSGNAGTYTVDQMISITCQASDNLSGIATSTCANISGPAYTFALGNNSFSASATDKAGNVGNGSTSFTLKVTFDSLCSLSSNFSTDPAVDKGLCDKLAAAKAAAAAGDTKTKNNNLEAYRQQVSAQSGKALTKQQATILTNLSKAL